MIKFVPEIVILDKAVFGRLYLIGWYTKQEEDDDNVDQNYFASKKSD